MKYFLLIFLTVPVLLSNKCQNSKTKSSSATLIETKLAIVDKEFDAINAAKDFEIKEAVITDSLLTINFKYKGCENDNFDLVFNGNFLKSYPPKATLYLVKKSVSADCNKEMTKVLSFVLTPVKYTGGKTLIISLPKYEPKVLYNY